jgi:hypothetical protein
MSPPVLHVLKVQPYDVAVFAFSRKAYRKQAKRLERNGAKVIGKELFTL